jgi:hypothetical protein
MGIGRNIEQRLHQGGFGICPQHVRVGTLAQGEPQGPDDHGFPGPGLAGQHIESRTEFHHGAFNQRVVFNVELY